MANLVRSTAHRRARSLKICSRGASAARWRGTRYQGERLVFGPGPATPLHLTPQLGQDQVGMPAAAGEQEFVKSDGRGATAVLLPRTVRATGAEQARHDTTRRGTTPQRFDAADRCPRSTSCRPGSVGHEISPGSAWIICAKRRTGSKGSGRTRSGIARHHEGADRQAAEQPRRTGGLTGTARRQRGRQPWTGRIGGVP